MKLLCAVLCASALSACALDEREDLDTETQELKPIPPFEVLWGLDGNCSTVNIFSNWTTFQPDAANVEYTLVDLSSGGVFTLTSAVTANGTNLNTIAIGQLDKGGHRFRLDGRLLRGDGGVIFTDSYKGRLPCYVPVQ